MLSVEKVYETFLSHDVDFFTGVTVKSARAPLTLS